MRDGDMMASDIQPPIEAWFPDERVPMRDGDSRWLDEFWWTRVSRRSSPHARWRQTIEDYADSAVAQFPDDRVPMRDGDYAILT